MATETRDALLAATVKAVRAGDSPSLQQLARAAGLTTGAVYSQFSGRAELLVEAAFAEGGSEIVNSLRRHRSLLGMERAMSAEASMDPLVLAIVEARRDSIAASVAASRIEEVCGGDRQQTSLLAFGLTRSLLGSVGLDVRSRALFEGGSRKDR